MATLHRVMSIAFVVVMGCGKGSKSGSGGGSSSGSSSAGSASGAPTSGALAGTWTGTWKRSPPGPPGGGDLVLMTGATTTLKRVGTMCPPEETPATVSVAGDKVTIEVATPDVKATFTGTRNGSDISGELVTTCSLGTGTGTWMLTAK
jgi:hypothetical protein